MDKWPKAKLIASSWLRELWINARYEPVKLLPCTHPVRRLKYWASAGEWVCQRCGSSKARVQARGQAARDELHRRLA
jgi:hypothetical protein